jgi:hypothetical protein
MISPYVIFVSKCSYFRNITLSSLGCIEQKELDQLESEREQLRGKLGKLQTRVRAETDVANFQDILAATSALRKGTAHPPRIYPVHLHRVIHD